MAKRGYTQTALRNTLVKENSIYRGVNTNFKSQNGYEFELQFHTPKSIIVKEKLNHELYEEARKPITTLERLNELNRLKTENSKTIPTPPGIEKIK